jgi:hypothetical protein
MSSIPCGRCDAQAISTSENSRQVWTNAFTCLIHAPQRRGTPLLAAIRDRGWQTIREPQERRRRRLNCFVSDLVPDFIAFCIDLMPGCRILLPGGKPISSCKSVIPTDKRWKIPMLNLILVALTLMSLGVRAANADRIARIVPVTAKPGRLNRSADRRRG